VTSSLYDEAGRLTRQVNERGAATTWNYGTNEAGEATVTTVQPDGATVVETAYRDEQPKSVTGTAVRARFHDYGADENGAWTVTYEGTDNGAPQWVKTYTDMLGRETAVVYPDGYRRETFYDSAGRPVRSADGWTTRLTGYNCKGEAFRSAVDMDVDGAIGLAGPDRITETDSGCGTFQGKKARWTETRVYDLTGSNRVAVTGKEWQSVDGTVAWTMAFGRTSRVDALRQPAAAARTETATGPDGTRVVSCYTNGLLKSVRRETAGGQVLAGQTFAHDAFGRVESRAETGPGGQIVQTRYGYDAGGLLTNETVDAGT